jgi:hypothetical protein
MLHKHDDPTEYGPFIFVKSYFVALLNSTLFLWFSVANMLALVHAGLLLAYMEHFHASSKEDPTLPYLFDSLNMIVAALYYSVMQDTELAGTGEQEVYYALLQEILYVAIRADKATRDALCYVVVLADHIYRPSGWRIGLDEQMPEGMYLEGTPQERFDRVYITLVKRGKESFLEGVKQRLMLRERQVTIQSPTFKTQYGMAVLFLWFGLWMPVRLWMSPLGVFGTLFVYPIIMYVFMAPLLFKWWVGDAWSRTRPWRNVSHEFWPVTFINRINALDPIQETEA